MLGWKCPSLSFPHWSSFVEGKSFPIHISLLEDNVLAVHIHTHLPNGCVETVSLFLGSYIPASREAGIKLLLAELGQVAFLPHMRAVSSAHPLGKHLSSADESLPGEA